jgi:hypothetical protein
MLAPGRATAQALLRFDDERHWLRIAPRLIGHLFPRLLRQPEYNTRLRAAAPLMEAALRWLADGTPATAEMLRLMDATPVPCGQSAVTAKRSDLYGWAGYGYCPSHSRWYWGAKLLPAVRLIVPGGAAGRAVRLRRAAARRRGAKRPARAGPGGSRPKRRR